MRTYQHNPPVHRLGDEADRPCGIVDHHLVAGAVCCAGVKGNIMTATQWTAYYRAWKLGRQANCLSERMWAVRERAQKARERAREIGVTCGYVSFGGDKGKPVWLGAPTSVFLLPAFRQRAYVCRHNDDTVLCVKAERGVYLLEDVAAD